MPSGCGSGIARRSINSRMSGSATGGATETRCVSSAGGGPEAWPPRSAGVRMVLGAAGERDEADRELPLAGGGGRDRQRADVVAFELEAWGLQVDGDLQRILGEV